MNQAVQKLSSVRARLGADAGFTLIELIVAVAILAIAFTVIVGGMGTAIVVSDFHRKQTTAETVLRNYAEAIEGAGYVACSSAGPGSYVTSSVTIPTNFNSVTSIPVASWNGSSSTSCPSADTGSEIVSLSVSSTDGRVSEKLDIVKRAP